MSLNEKIQKIEEQQRRILDLQEQLKNENLYLREEIREKYKEPPPAKEKKPKPERSRQSAGRREQRRRDKKWRKKRRARKG